MSEPREFDGNAANSKGFDMALRVPHGRRLSANELVSLQTNSFVDGARWQFTQDKVAYDSLSERLKAAEAERNILRSKASQFESTIAETCKMRDQFMAQVERYRGVLELFATSGHIEKTFPDGFKRAREALADYKEEKRK